MLHKAFATLGLSKDSKPAPGIDPKATEKLEQWGVATCSACDSCPDNSFDEEGLQGLAADSSFLRAWSSQEIDTDSTLLGATSPFLRQVIISSGKTDWVKDVSSVEGSVAQLLSQTIERAAPNAPEQPAPPVPGLWDTPAGASSATDDRVGPTRLTFQNGSFISSADHGEETCLVFPDFVAISPVPSLEAPLSAGEVRQIMDQIHDHWLAPAQPTLSRGALSPNEDVDAKVRRWVLPYSAVIMVCSHKKRDARCHISAGPLKDSFARAAAASGWEVDERGDELHAPEPKQWGYIDPSLSLVKQQEQELHWRKESLGRAHHEGGHAPVLGLFSISHIGGHKFAGNVIVYLPNGAGVWYGRVNPASPMDVQQVWSDTVLGGKINTRFLRAGINLRRRHDDEQDGEVVSGSQQQLQACNKYPITDW